MDRKTKQSIIGAGTAIVIILTVVIIFLVRMFTPSKIERPLEEYYPLQDGEVLVLLNNEIYDRKGIYIDDHVYIDFETVQKQLNYRFYWDEKSNLLIYTTPTEIIKAEANQSEYSVIKSVVESKESYNCPIVKVFKNQVYVELDFVKQYSRMEHEFYSKPNRVEIRTDFEDKLVTVTTKGTQLRVEPDIKSDLLVQLSNGTHLTLFDIEDAPKNGFIKVITDDGIIGYVKKKHTKETFYETSDFTYKEPEYTSIKKSYTINMVWHQVFNLDAYKNLEDLVKTTKGVTTVSPTWFKVCDNEGNINSLASKEYVDKANMLGLEVWALVDDFTYEEISMYEILSNTKSREHLENTLISAVQEYKLNGINIDFEKISKDTAPHYIQFLREMSVKCRNNGIVLSVDNYVPSDYTAHYDRTEQGNIVDYLIVMAYDEHYAGSEVTGSVSSIGFVRNAVKNIVSLVPAEKAIIALPFYTRLWKTDADGSISSEAMGMMKAFNTLKENSEDMAWDDVTGQYYGSYEKDGAKYEMWLEEDESFEEKLKAVFEYKVAGIAGWKLGLEKESIWNVISRYIY